MADAPRWHRTGRGSRWSFAIFAGVIAIIAGAIITPIGVSGAVETAQIEANGVTVDGTVVEEKRQWRGRTCCRNPYSVATVTFETAEGKMRTTTVDRRISAAAPRYSVGEPIAIVYDSTDPSRTQVAGARIEEALRPVIVGAATIGAGVILIVAGTVFVRRHKRKTS